jgi:hypothetical protein
MGVIQMQTGVMETPNLSVLPCVLMCRDSKTKAEVRRVGASQSSAAA